MHIKEHTAESVEGYMYDPDELGGLPEPVRRLLGRAIAPGTPHWASGRLRMRGSIKLGRWLPFRAREVLTPHQEFVWAARIAGVVTGADRYTGGRGSMEWKLAGLIRLVQADGPDVSRSAAERAGARRGPDRLVFRHRPVGRGRVLPLPDHRPPPRLTGRAPSPALPAWPAPSLAGSGHFHGPIPVTRSTAIWVT